MRRFTLLPLPLLLLACAPSDGGDDTGSGTDTEDTNDDTDTEDTEDDTVEETEDEDVAPTVVSMSPADGAAGVLPDATLTLTFNVAMDADSVEAALTSNVLGEGYTLAWPAPDQLVITPTDPLPVDSYDPEALGAEVDVALSQDALSADGVPMDGPYWASFRVARSFQMTLVRETARSGRIAGSGGFTDGFVQVGDTSDNRTYRSFLTFPMDEVPTILDVEQAVLLLDLDNITGTPWASLGDFQVHPLRFDAPTDGLYGAPTLIGTVTGHIPGEAATMYNLDVTTLLEVAVADRSETDDVVQLRLAFQDATDDDSGVDGVIFALDGDGPRLVVDVRVE